MNNFTKKIIAFVVLPFAGTSAFAQVGFVSKTNIYIESGVTLAVQTHFDNQNGGGTVNNAGEIRVSGNFNNTGTANIDETVVLDGNANQSVTGVSSFPDVLEVDKTGGVATVTSGQTDVPGILRLNTGEIAANGNLVITSTPSGTGLVDDFSNPAYTGNVSGNLRVQRYFASGAGFHLIGSPVNTPSITTELSEFNPYGPNNGQIIPLTTCDPDASWFNSPYGSILEWREEGPYAPAPYGWAPTCTQWGWFVRSAGTLTNGRGYAATTSGAITMEISGTDNTSEITTISNGGLANTNAVGQGWHIVSNPFPSPMIYHSPVAGFNAAVQLFQTTGSYQGNYIPKFPGPASLIASSQGFYAQATGGAASWALDQSYRSLGDPGFFKEDLTNTFDIVAEISGLKSETRVRFGDDGETNEFDPMLDAEKMTSRGTSPTLRTRLDRVYSVNSLSLEEHPMTVPMDFIPGSSGKVAFTAEHLDQFTVEAHVYLEDLKLNKIQELTIDPTYEFEAYEADDPERFLLHFRLNGEDPLYVGDDVLMYANDGTAFVFLPEVDGNTQFQVFDALGSLVFEEGSLVEGKNSFDLSHLATGAYVMRATVADKPISKKVVL